MQPFAALSLGLKKAGFEVLIAASDENADFAAAHNIPFKGLGLSLKEWSEKERLKEDDAKRQKKNFFDFLGNTMRSFFTRSVEACKEADLIIYGGLAFFWAENIGEYLGIPTIPVHLQPQVKTGEFSSFIMPVNFPLKALNRFSHTFLHGILWKQIKNSINKIRRDHGMSQCKDSPAVVRLEKDAPVINGFSSHVVPKPADWPEHHHLTGYWFLDPETNWMPDPDLKTFLEAGEKPFYFGFGSMMGGDPRRLTETIIEALEKSGQRGVLLGGWGGLNPDNLSSSIHYIESAPHNILFPKMKAAFHHGGAGTTAASLRAGIPTGILPFLADQPFWGKCVSNLGAGPKPIHHKKITSDRLASLIDTILTDKRMQTSAAQIGEKLRNEDGVANAVKVIEGVFN